MKEVFVSSQSLHWILSLFGKSILFSYVKRHARASQPETRTKDGTERARPKRPSHGGTGARAGSGAQAGALCVEQAPELMRRISSAAGLLVDLLPLARGLLIKVPVSG